MSSPNKSIFQAYTEYKSPYGPKYHYQQTAMGFSGKQIFGLGLRSSAFGAVALFTVVFLASGIPRVQRDVLQKVPFLSGYYVKDVPASDNPF